MFFSERSLEIKTVFELVGYEIRTIQNAFTILESTEIHDKLSTCQSNDFVSNTQFNFAFKLNLDKNMIRYECEKLSHSKESKFELVVFDLCGNMLKKNIFF